MSIDYLEALEVGRWNEIPRAYLRGYLGLYAHAVGMNREKVLRSFDQMISPMLNVGRANLDETPPLLNQPEHVEVTRIKIRTTWFAALSRNRKALYLLTFLLVLVVIGSLYISRRVQRDSVQLIPFSVALKENSIRVHSPITEICLIADSFGRAGGHWVKLIGTASGSAVYNRSDSNPKMLSFTAYDTINIEYIHDLTLKIHPIRSALCYIEDSLIYSDTLLAGDSEFYRIGTCTNDSKIRQSSLDSLR